MGNITMLKLHDKVSVKTIPVEEERVTVNGKEIIVLKTVSESKSESSSVFKERRGLNVSSK